MLEREIGPYQLRELLGRGGMGEVYRAHDARLGRDVAIKRVHDLASESARDRLRREARMLAQVHHATLVPIYDILERDDGDWLVMELVDGTRLDHLIDDGPVTADEAVDYGIQIAEGLAAVHARGILHRDLKTENVMVTAESRIRILDFGLARPVEGHEHEPSLSTSGQILGTPRTMSPEQARGVVIDRRSDLFSLGVLLYELVTGESPFVDTTIPGTMVRVCSHIQTPAHVLDDQVPLALSRLIDELLAKAPELRPQDAAEVVARLSEMRAGEPPTQRAVAHGVAGDVMDQARDVTDESRDVTDESRDVTEAARDATNVVPDVTVDLGGSEKPQAEVAGDEAEAEAEPGDEPESAGHEPGWHERVRQDSAAQGHGRLIAILVMSSLAVLALVAYLATTGYVTQRASVARPQVVGSQLEATPIGDPAPSTSVATTYQLLQHGRALLARPDRKGAIDEAIRVFEELIARDPESAAGHAGLAHACWYAYSHKSRDPVWLGRARSAAERALSLDEHLAWAHLAQARIDRSDGQPDAARQQLARVLELQPDNAKAYLELGLQARSEGDLDQAEAALRQGLERDARDREILDELGALMYQRGRLDQAETFFRTSIEVAPDSVFGYRNLAAVLHATGRLDEAARALQEALEIRPEASVYGNLGTLYFFQGAYQQAAEAFEKALAQPGGANEFARWADLGDALRQIPKRADEAQEAYAIAIRLAREALARRQDDTDLASRLSLYLARSGECAAGRLELIALSEKTGLSASAHYRMAVAYELCQDRRAAFAQLREAIVGGYPPQEIEREPDLLELRAAPGYQRMLQRARMDQEPTP